MFRSPRSSALFAAKPLFDLAITVTLLVLFADTSNGASKFSDDNSALEAIGKVVVKNFELQQVGTKEQKEANTFFKKSVYIHAFLVPGFLHIEPLQSGRPGPINGPAQADGIDSTSGGATNLSRNGRIAVGFADTGINTPTQAFYHTDATGLVRVGTLDPNNVDLDSRAFDVSDDGRVVVGDATTAIFFSRAFRWTEETGLVSLGTATGDGEDDFSRAFGVNGDGTVIVGGSTFETSFGKREDAFRWTEAGGFQNLNDGKPGRSLANAVTADGNVIVGGALNHAFRWSRETGLVDLGMLPGDNQSIATAVSDDGNIVVGISTTGLVDRASPYYRFDERNSRAFYWTAENGIQDLTQLLTDAGVDMSDTPLVGARGISPDGTWIGGISIVPDPDFPDKFVDQIPVFVSLTATIPTIDFDLNGDSFVDVKDIDLLVGEIVAGGNEGSFDLTGDNVINDADVRQWLSGAARVNGFREAYLAGDADLDGTVDAGDLNSLALNWQQNIGLWSGGDFTADGVVNAADLNALAINWRQSTPLAATVPEPSASLLVTVLWLFWDFRVHRAVLAKIIREC